MRKSMTGGGKVGVTGWGKVATTVRLKANKRQFDGLEVCILAGGLSSRMGRDKARLRLGRFTVLGMIRATAKRLGVPVRVIRKDLVPRCGPLGGVYTALKGSRGEAVLFLSCDMPFVSAGLLEWLSRSFGSGRRPVFMCDREDAGFPFVMRCADLVVVERQLEQKVFSLQKLAVALEARVVKCPRAFAGELLNVNTPEDWAVALGKWREGETVGK